MSEPKDESKGVDRRSVMKGALAVGGASILGSVAAVPQAAVDGCAVAHVRVGSATS